MGSPSCLIDPRLPVVVDTSAAINLVATGVAQEILRALPNPVLATDAVPAELAQGSRRGRRDAGLMDELVTAQLIEVATLGNAALQIFEGLVVGRAADTLDDGEAATIAYAVEHHAMAIIDERKANRICGERYPELQVGCTIDLLSHPGVVSALGPDQLSMAVLNALQLARMRVLPHHIDWVVGLLGPERTSLCMSLPRSARRATGKA
jgi:predicted nucleic acid-binding protein